ncbi:hypothetical protein mRhiFer1_009764 [Rhinolophus ferrumequinum]|uniref:Uncharacterized protein n=1 Tax=Rhinolophus ferrumequinum TaxID=59479 RepID=A0A7J7ZD91_RHIFE|nr:hypothetical protein mRhiFer1_009764 [Rhinolophus ferrumequinum]
MKTVPLLVCICALSACFTLSEGQHLQWKIYHKKNNNPGFISYHQPPFHPKFRSHLIQLIQKQALFHQYKRQKPSNSKRRKFILPKYPWIPKCSVENDMAVNKNTLKSTTQIPHLLLPKLEVGSSPTSISAKIAPSPVETPLVQNVSTVSAGESDVATDSSAAAPQPSSVPPETTASPNTTLKFSATTLEPETSKTTAASTTQTRIPVTIQITTLEQTTSPSVQKAIFRFWEYTYKIAKHISDIINGT